MTTEQFNSLSLLAERGQLEAILQLADAYYGCKTPQLNIRKARELYQQALPLLDSEQQSDLIRYAERRISEINDMEERGIYWNDNIEDCWCWDAVDIVQSVSRTYGSFPENLIITYADIDRIGLSAEGLERTVYMIRTWDVEHRRNTVSVLCTLFRMVSDPDGCNHGERIMNCSARIE